MHALLRGSRVTLAPITLALWLSASTAHAEEPAPESRPNCVGPAIAGAFVGLAAGYGLAVGGLTLAGRGLSSSGSMNALDVTIVATGEVAGMVAGPMLLCPLGDDPRRVPAASYLIGGASLGMAVLTIPVALVMVYAKPFGDEGDNPAGAALSITGAAIAGGIAGGYLGWRLHRAREPRDDIAVSLRPSLSPTHQGLTLNLTF